jgi:hypothetical protein
MCSFQTSTGTLLMFLVEEKMGAAAVDEDDELLLVFCRLAGFAVAALLVPVVCSGHFVDISERGGLVVVSVFRITKSRKHQIDATQYL